jgi:hypothetical protein
MKSYYYYLDAVLSAVSTNLSGAISEQEAALLRTRISRIRAQIRAQIASLEQS